MYNTYVALENLITALDNLYCSDFYYDNDTLIDSLKYKASDLKYRINEKWEREE